MNSTSRPSLSDRRPAPLWVQGLVTGMALSLVPVAIVTLYTDAADKSLHLSTEILVYVAVAVLALAIAAYVPVPTEHRPAESLDLAEWQGQPTSTPALRVVAGERPQHRSAHLGR